MLLKLHLWSENERGINCANLCCYLGKSLFLQAATKSTAGRTMNVYELSIHGRRHKVHGWNAQNKRPLLADFAWVELRDRKNEYRRPGSFPSRSSNRNSQFPSTPIANQWWFVGWKDPGWSIQKCNRSDKARKLISSVLILSNAENSHQIT